MRDAICLECRAEVDSCWRWCPECGSLALLYPEGSVGLQWRDYDDFSVEWELECTATGTASSRDGRPPVAARP